MSDYPRCKGCQMRREVDPDSGLCNACLYEPAADPTPIDPADIRPGDVVRMVSEFTVKSATPETVTAADDGEYPGMGYLKREGTWHLVHRPRPGRGGRPGAGQGWHQRTRSSGMAPRAGLGPHEAAVVSDLERAQEWLGCERDEFLHLTRGERVPFCDTHNDTGWPCPEATRLAALLAETRADEATNIADALSRCGGMSIKTASALIRDRALRHHRASKP